MCKVKFEIQCSSNMCWFKVETLQTDEFEENKNKSSVFTASAIGPFISWKGHSNLHMFAEKFKPFSGFRWRFFVLFL